MIQYRGFVRISTLVPIVLIMILPNTKIASCESGIERARSAIELSEEALSSAYISVLEAERAGGDVSELVVLLNTALEHRSEAERALESGEYELAIVFSGKVVEVANMVLEADIGLIVVAEKLGETEFRYQLFRSLGVICMTIPLGFFGWRLFKGYYVRRMMNLKPEMVSDES